MSEFSYEDLFDPYANKTAAEIVHDYAVVRGDLSEQYARDQLANLIERREKLARERWEKVATDTHAEMDHYRERMYRYRARYNDFERYLGILLEPQWRTNRGHEYDSLSEAYAAGRNDLIDELRSIMSTIHQTEREADASASDD